MRYIDDGKTKNIDNQKLKSNLEAYYQGVENLSYMLNNSNIVGTYSEILVCSVLDLEKQKDSNKSVDAIGIDGATYQIKSRWNKSFLTKKSGQNEFGSFSFNENGRYSFDFLILVYYDESLLKPRVFKINSLDINKLLGNGAYLKENRVIFRYNSLFKKALENNLYIFDISYKFENIYD